MRRSECHEVRIGNLAVTEQMLPCESFRKRDIRWPKGVVRQLMNAADHQDCVSHRNRGHLQCRVAGDADEPCFREWARANSATRVVFEPLGSSPMVEVIGESKSQQNVDIEQEWSSSHLPAAEPFP